MYYHCFTFIGFLVIWVLSFVNTAPPQKLIGGPNAKLGEFPYIVSIRKNGEHFCGGTIISNRHILIAAHCMEERIKPPFRDITVVSSTINLLKGGEEHKIIKAIVHPDFKTSSDRSKSNDIAILKLSEPMVFNLFQQPITLPGEPVSEKTKGVLIGWGYRDPKIEILSKDLKKLYSEISPETCLQYLGYERYYEQLCGVQKPSKQGVCQADSGGSLIVKGKIVGIASSVANSCDTQFPDVYTNVYLNLNFIRESMTL